MTKRGIVFLIILVFIFTLISFSQVSAIGISGIRLVENLDFEPFMERTFHYRIGTNADHAMNYSVYVKDMEGNIASYITPSVETVYIEPATGYDFSATMRLPESLEAGLHVAHICVLEGETRGEAGGNIGVKTEVCAVIKVKVLYPGKYLEINSFDISVANKQVNFEIVVESWGTQRIDSTQALIDIYEVNETSKIITVQTNEVSLESNTKATLRAALNAEGFDVGDYLAKAKVVYDFHEAETEKQFKLGELELRIVNYTNVFELDKISPMEIEVESIWNQPIKDIHVEVNVSKSEKTVQIIKTPPGDIEPWGRVILLSYFDTNGLEAGEYDSNFNIFYAGKATSTYGTITVKERERVPLAISMNTILLLAILILLIILILLVLRRKKKR